MRKMSAGAGYRYLLDSVAVGDGAMGYYLEVGTPPGRWLGSACPDLGVRRGSVVGEVELERLFGAGCHPLSGEPLGRVYPVYAAGSGRSAVNGHEKLPVGGHGLSPLVATGSPRWWPPGSPRVRGW